MLDSIPFPPYSYNHYSWHGNDSFDGFKSCKSYACCLVQVLLLHDARFCTGGMIEKRVETGSSSNLAQITRLVTCSVKKPGSACKRKQHLAVLSPAASSLAWPVAFRRLVSAQRGFGPEKGRHQASMSVLQHEA